MVNKTQNSETEYIDDAMELAYRKDFPALYAPQKLSYLDTASSAQKPASVIAAMNDVLHHHYANIHRGLYSNSQITTEKFEAVRGKVARFINAPSENEIVFTRNTTEAINLVVQSWARDNLEAGDEVILSEMEHHANIVPWHFLRDEIGIVLKVIPLLDDGTLNMTAYERLFTPQTKMVSCIYISNALGTINPIKEMIAYAKDFYPEIKVLVDGTQAVVHQKVDVQDLGCDFFTFTGHKLYGPSGVGVLWGRYDILNQMRPYQGGGDMIETVDFDRVTFKPPPSKFEAGTPAIVEVIGLGAAIDYINDIGLDVIKAHENALYRYMKEQMDAIEGIRLFGDHDNKIALASFLCEWGHASDVAMILDQCGVAVRTGHHCCQPIMKRYGVDATIRASIGLYTNKADIDLLIEGLKKAKDMLA